MYVRCPAKMNTSASPPLESARKGAVWESTRTGSVPKRETSARVMVNSKFFFQGGSKHFIKGVAYGPFKPRPPEDGGSDPIHFPECSRVESDLDHIRQAGINTIRLYHTPPRWLLDKCHAAQIKALITIPWEQHVSFLDNLKLKRAIRERVAGAVAANRNHPAIFAYAVGNEIRADLVRWHGSYKVERFIESLVETAREVDSRPLYTYANYPPTEYLLPGSIDFYCYNVYLHQQADFQRYMARLQNLAGEKPLMIGEFGMDVMRHSEEEQARLFHWHIQTAARMGLAGTILFSWTDEWFTGGHLIEDWKFGLVDAQRRPRKAFFEVQRLFKDTHRVPLPRYPSVSVVVCSYNGARTLEACLTSLLQMDYPDYEIILVDDGSADDTPRIAKEFPKVKTIRQENMGLSVARNVGMETARGEVIAYTDSDCMADNEWLYYLVGTLEQGNYAAVGGPNISPPARSWIQACVAASPGQPSHVLIDDSEAEHIPGCNMAFYKWVLEAVGGFDPEYRKAGDDVDICWRLIQQGYHIGFSPSAVVWHHRRFNIRAYFEQQDGYGEAEALLRFKHFVHFGPTGSAKWHGQVYGNPRFSSLFHRPLVHHGVFGMGLFQCIYPQRSSDLVQLMSSLEWNALTFITFLVALQVQSAWYVPAFLLACTIGAGVSYGLRARLESPYRGIWSQMLVSLLAMWQPIERGWARYYTWMKKKRTPRQVLVLTPEAQGLKFILDHPALLSFWNEQGRGREQLLSALKTQLDQEGWKYSADTGWTNWDYQIYGNHWWQIRLLTVTEEHGDGKRLTRVRLHPTLTTFSRLLGCILGAASLLVFLRFQNGSTYEDALLQLEHPEHPLHLPTTPEKLLELGRHVKHMVLVKNTTEADFYLIGTWFCIIALWLAFMVWKSARLRKRIAQLIELAARECELEKMLAR